MRGGHYEKLENTVDRKKKKLFPRIFSYTLGKPRVTVSRA